jgi:hypothetical protein
MKRAFLLTALMMFASASWAQAKPPVKKEEAKAASKPAAAGKSRRSQDARACLGQPNNTAIIKCAEAYL